MSKYDALRAEMRALGYDESVISDHALRQSLDNAQKRANARAKVIARELRKVSREQLEEFVRAPINVDKNLATFQGEKFYGYQSQDTYEILLDLVQNKFDIYEDTTEAALQQNWDLVIEFQSRFDRAMMRVHLHDIIENIVDNTEYIVRIPRDRFMEAVGDAYDRATCQSVMELTPKGEDQ